MSDVFIEVLREEKSLRDVKFIFAGVGSRSTVYFFVTSFSMRQSISSYNAGSGKARGHARPAGQD